MPDTNTICLSQLEDKDNISSIFYKCPQSLPLQRIIERIQEYLCKWFRVLKKKTFNKIQGISSTNKESYHPVGSSLSSAEEEELRLVSGIILAQQQTEWEAVQRMKGRLVGAEQPSHFLNVWKQKDVGLSNIPPCSLLSDTKGRVWTESLILSTNMKMTNSWKKEKVHMCISIFIFLYI